MVVARQSTASPSRCGLPTMSADRGSAARRPAERVSRRLPAARTSVCGTPGLFLDDEIRFDREDAAPVAEVQQLDQLGIDVELVAVLAEPAGDAEAQPLRAIRHPERRIEPGRDQAATAAGASLAKAGHRTVR